MKENNIYLGIARDSQKGITSTLGIRRSSKKKKLRTLWTAGKGMVGNTDSEEHGRLVVQGVIADRQRNMVTYFLERLTFNFVRP